jgi:hypothetical protein
MSKLQGCVAKARVATGGRRSRRSDHRVPVYQDGRAALDESFLAGKRRGNRIL